METPLSTNHLDPNSRMHLDPRYGINPKELIEIIYIKLCTPFDPILNSAGTEFNEFGARFLLLVQPLICSAAV